MILLPKTPEEQISFTWMFWNISLYLHVYLNLNTSLPIMRHDINKKIISTFLKRTGLSTLQKHSPRVVPRKRCSEIMRQIYRRTPMLKCDFNKVACNFIDITLQHGCSPVNLLHIFRTPFLKNTCAAPFLEQLLS